MGQKKDKDSDNPITWLTAVLAVGALLLGIYISHSINGGAAPKPYKSAVEEVVRPVGK